MAFVPRTYETIFIDMWNYVKSSTKLTDQEIGSVIRTTLEAAALEDDEQYFQMVQLLDAFSINNATGPDLIRRLADYNIIQLQPKVSTGTVVIQDGSLPKSTLVNDILLGTNIVTVVDSTGFPASGFTVRIGEGTILVEDVFVSANNTSTGVLTTLPTINDHSANDRVSLVNGAADKTIAPGQQIQVPSSSDEPPIKFVTVESGLIVNGNFQSGPIRAKSTIPGSNGNVGVGTITQFTSSSPFTGALVTNITNFSGGRDLETEPEIKDRARAQLQSLSRGTKLAITQASLGISDEVTGQTAKTANILEDFVNDEVILYIDDGSGFTPDVIDLSQSSVDATQPTAPGQITMVVDDASKFPGAGYLVVSPDDPVEIELLQYSSVDYVTNTFTLASATLRTHDVSDEVLLVDTISLDAEPGTRFFNTAKYPIVRDSIRLWLDQGSGLIFQTLGTDYLLNKGNGNIEMTESGVAAHSTLVSNYSYYTGLVADVQKVIYGDSTDSVTFPGVSAAGIIVTTETPIIRRISIRISISVVAGLNEFDVAPLVRESIENYISGLGIGKDVILAAIVQRSMEVPGVTNAIITTPLSDIVILESELPVPFDSSGNSLVVVV